MNRGQKPEISNGGPATSIPGSGGKIFNRWKERSRANPAAAKKSGSPATSEPDASAHWFQRATSEDLFLSPTNAGWKLLENLPPFARGLASGDMETRHPQQQAL